VKDETGAIRDLAEVYGGQGTMNVPSWDPAGERIAIVAYPLTP
jgi:TolB protein